MGCTGSPLACVASACQHASRAICSRYGMCTERPGARTRRAQNTWANAMVKVVSLIGCGEGLAECPPIIIYHQIFTLAPDSTGCEQAKRQKSLGPRAQYPAERRDRRDRDSCRQFTLFTLLSDVCSRSEFGAVLYAQRRHIVTVGPKAKPLPSMTTDVRRFRAGARAQTCAGEYAVRT